VTNPTWAGSVRAYSGLKYGQITVDLYVGTGVRIVLAFPDLGYDNETHDFGTGEDVDAYLAVRFPDGYKAGLYGFGQKMVAIQ